MSTALTGPAADLGSNMRAGVLAAFAEANARGGVHGRKLELTVLDDGYEPDRAAPNMRTLVEDPSVLGIIGNVGTPTAIAAIPIANESRTLFFGAFTGAGVLRRVPPDRYVINFRASYAEETAAMVDALVTTAGLRPGEIGFFTQRDGYGDSGFRGGIEALKRHGLESEHGVAHGRYERNTLAVEGALAEILRTDPPPRAVIMVGAYAPCARFIELADEYGLDARFLNVSFVGSASLARELGARGDGVVITQVVPHPEADYPLVRAYRAAAVHGDLPATFGALEGYAAARTLILALRQATPPLGREQVVDALEALGSFDVGIGRQLHLSAQDHQASHRVWPTVIRGGEVVPMEWEELAPAFARDRP
ncbi:MAG: ABC transporter substrate-binding protein [Myxococcales bacterium]|nr:ABC transporter substrate-binding protein [Myxococcales bacterium]